MKKFFVALMVACLTVPMIGCGGKPAEKAPEKAPEKAAEKAPEKPADK